MDDPFLGVNTPDEDLEVLASLVNDIQPDIAVEVGSWAGRSALAILETIRENEGRLFCVDTWRGNANDPMRQAANDYGGDVALKAFCSNMGVDLFTHVFPLVGTSRFWAGVFPAQFADFVYLDSDHTFTSVIEDIRLWRPKLCSGGWLAGHDYNHKLFPGVVEAVHEMFPDEAICINGNVWSVRITE